MNICYTYYIMGYASKRNGIIEKHKEDMEHNDNTNFFYQRALLDSFNLSIGILITAIVIFRMK